MPGALGLRTQRRTPILHHAPQLPNTWWGGIGTKKSSPKTFWAGIWKTGDEDEEWRRMMMMMMMMFFVGWYSDMLLNMLVVSQVYVYNVVQPFGGLVGWSFIRRFGERIGIAYHGTTMTYALENSHNTWKLTPWDRKSSSKRVPC